MNAVFSPCGLYRYRLERDLGRAGPTVAMIGVNPSIANDDRNDQTIRKDIGFGERHGWGRLIKGNLFALVSTDIKGLRRLETGRDPVNDDHLRQIMADADIVVACWGPPAKVPSHLRGRWRTVAAISDAVGRPLHCLGITKDGHPRHTLTTGYAVPLTLWERPR
ncbi:DUF1643 domain-containing protein [Brevundimonas viscosa]|uniref:DUF1643 domain-containing protein n=1 Tax=Brevundimonas viscosa TaxID=871741 RepID=A0A1I6PQI0_9CAUL|nr:DUF1643 domain-containing protein [Brevundimonas viscosa]SFS42482.1 hypothetical protein SAMN05192570_1186 [Brevundimonas viscosa]